MRPPRSLLFVSLAMLALRTAWILAYREIDSDAYGHYFIAIATRNDPGNVAVHWVWLPLWHFLVAGLVTVGGSFRGLRLLNGVLAGLAPLLLHDVVRRRNGEPAATLAALLFAVAPLTTILGQSAQPETLFSLLVVLSVFLVERERPGLAGLALAVACFVRYEAWGGALALVLWWGAMLVVRRPRPSLAWVGIPAAAIALYVAFRWWTDARLLSFFRGTKDITALQVDRPGWTFREIVSFPVVLPFIVLGPALALVPAGLRAALPGPRGWVFPLGLAAFLLLSYYGGGSHAGERYLVSLVPFACAAIAVAAVRIGERVRRPRLVAALVVASMALTTAWHLQRARGMAIVWSEGLAAREAELERHARAAR